MMNGYICRLVIVDYVLISFWLRCKHTYTNLLMILNTLITVPIIHSLKNHYYIYVLYYLYTTSHYFVSTCVFPIVFHQYIFFVYIRPFIQTIRDFYIFISNCYIMSPYCMFLYVWNYTCKYCMPVCSVTVPVYLLCVYLYSTDLLQYKSSLSWKNTRIAR